MSDIIQILPDSIANQIAAGEVIQRPASVVKELLENAIDAGASEIQVVVKDAGKTLIQIIDNGKGMSETDARLSFERHSTSKIKDSKDLFSIQTFGFRGEALASIAAVAQIDLKTRRNIDNLGTQIIIEASHLKEQNTCNCSTGANFSIKNLFFNVPARRRFLKTDKLEFFHIINEFFRIALANEHIKFSLYHNNKQIYLLEPTTLKLRIVSVLGNKAKEMLIPVEQETDTVKIHGFIGKPEFAKRRNGEQYFYVNQRFMRHPLFHRFVENAYQGIIPSDAVPSYFIYFTINPEKIDVNIHPTKTEIKFEDEHVIGATLRAAVRQSIGKHNILPSIDFDVEKSFDNIPFIEPSEIKQPQIKVNPNFNPFNTGHPSEKFKTNAHNQNLQHWQKLYDDAEISNKNDETRKNETQIVASSLDNETEKPQNTLIYQLQLKYITTQIKSGLMILDIENAQERIYFEKYIKEMSQMPESIQTTLFPVEIPLSPIEMQVFESIQKQLLQLGFNVKIADDDNKIILEGIPSDLKIETPEEFIRQAIEQFSLNSEELNFEVPKKLALSLAKSLSKKSLRLLSAIEMQAIIDSLFACEVPYISPSGKKTFITLTINELENKFITNN